MESKGITFGKFIHDRLKSAKSSKLQSFGFQCAKESFVKNSVLCLECVNSGNNTNNGVTKLLDETSIQVTGEPVDDIGSLMNSNDTAIIFSKAFDMEDN